MSVPRHCLALFWFVAASALAADGPRQLVFDGVLCEHRLLLKDLDPAMPADWTGYTHLVIEMRTTSPQRFGLWAYAADGPHRIEIQPLGQNVWLRASIPLQYFKGHGQVGHRPRLVDQPADKLVLDVGVGTVRRIEIGRGARFRDAVST